MCGVKPLRNCASRGCFKDLIPNEYPLQIHVLLSSKCLNNYYKFIPPNKTLLHPFPSLGMESASGRERAGSSRPDFLLCCYSELCADLSPAPQCQCSLQAVLPKAAPLSASSFSVSASPSAVPSFHPSSVWCLFLHKDCHAYSKMAHTAPGLSDLPGPAAKAHLGEPLPLKSKSPEGRI